MGVQKRGTRPRSNFSELQPVRLVTLRIGKNVLLPITVIVPIGDQRVLVSILIWHRLWGLCPATRHDSGWIGSQPEEVCLTAMDLLGPKTEAVLGTQGEAQTAQPHIVVQARARPDGRRVVLVPNRLIATLRDCLTKRGRAEIRGLLYDPVRRIEKLRSLENHLDHVLVTMPTRTARRLVRKIEYVHFGVRA